VVNGDIRLYRQGEIVLAAWFDLPWRYRYGGLGVFVLMPNHVRGIILQDETGGGEPVPVVLSGELPSCTTGKEHLSGTFPNHFQYMPEL